MPLNRPDSRPAPEISILCLPQTRPENRIVIARLHTQHLGSFRLPDHLGLSAHAADNPVVRVVDSVRFLVFPPVVHCRHPEIPEHLCEIKMSHEMSCLPPDYLARCRTKQTSHRRPESSQVIVTITLKGKKKTEKNLSRADWHPWGRFQTFQTCRVCCLRPMQCIGAGAERQLARFRASGATPDASSARPEPAAPVLQAKTRQHWAFLLALSACPDRDARSASVPSFNAVPPEKIENPAGPSMPPLLPHVSPRFERKEPPTGKRPPTHP